MNRFARGLLKRWWLLLIPVLLGGCQSMTGSSQAAPEISQARADIGETGDARNRARVNTELAALYYERRNLGVALEVLRTAANADPTYAPAQSMFGLVYMDLKQNALAQQSFERALQLSPNDADINHNYGWFLCQTGKEDEAIRYFMRAISNPLYQTPWKSYSAAGQCAMKSDKLKDAAGFFAQALKLEPDEPTALLKLAEIYYRTGQMDEARKLVSHYNRVTRPSAEGLWLGLRIERKFSDKTAEASYADQLRRHFPNSPEWHKLQRGEYD